ncbi:MAG: hypothetical protein CFH10_00659 [Alphaproteobacteria bacterium MarineAlpha4_Bin2]|nr:MAG: hypothetical protein CFH10_00659 [Alphaproteobacteria bacterium MarineAlpha4_Bin2]
MGKFTKVASVVCAFLLSTSIAYGSNKLEIALADFRLGYYEPAKQRFEELAEENNAEALFWLGLISQNGQGASQDFIRAAELYQRSAWLGNGDAQNNLGLLYRDGKGLPKDGALALAWFTVASEGKHRTGEINRSRFADRLDDEQFAKSQRLARNFKAEIGRRAKSPSRKRIFTKLAKLPNSSNSVALTSSEITVKPNSNLSKETDAKNHSKKSSLPNSNLVNTETVEEQPVGILEKAIKPKLKADYNVKRAEFNQNSISPNFPTRLRNVAAVGGEKSNEIEELIVFTPDQAGGAGLEELEGKDVLTVENSSFRKSINKVDTRKNKEAIAGKLRFQLPAPTSVLLKNREAAFPKLDKKLPNFKLKPERVYMVQLGIFRNGNNVQKIKSQLSELSEMIRLDKLQIGGVHMQRLRIGPYVGLTTAQTKAREFNSKLRVKSLIVKTKFEG